MNTRCLASDHHEAGHAVVAHVLGLDVSSIDFVRMDASVTGEPRKLIAAAYAGREAHLRFAPDEEEFATANSENDLEFIKVIRKDHGIGEAECDVLRQEAKDLVHQHWHAIEGIVAEVTARGGRVDNLLSQQLLAEATGFQGTNEWS